MVNKINNNNARLIQTCITKLTAGNNSKNNTQDDRHEAICLYVLSKLLGRYVKNYQK